MHNHKKGYVTVNGDIANTNKLCCMQQKLYFTRLQSQLSIGHFLLINNTALVRGVSRMGSIAETVYGRNQPCIKHHLHILKASRPLHHLGNCSLQRCSTSCIIYMDVVYAVVAFDKKQLAINSVTVTPLSIIIN